MKQANDSLTDVTFLHDYLFTFPLVQEKGQRENLQRRLKRKLKTKNG